MQRFVSLFLLIPAIAHGDILSSISPFFRSADPDYDANDFSQNSITDHSRRAPFSPADSDFGIQEILGDTSQAAKFNFFGNIDFNYTDNAPAKLGGAEDGSFFSVARFGGSYQSLLAAGWFADLGASIDSLEFERSQALDFQNLNTHVGLVKTLVDLDDSVFFLRYEYQRLTTGSFSQSDYSAQRLRAGLQKVLFARSNQELSASVSYAPDLDANAELLERVEYAAELSYTYWLFENVGASLSWRAAYWDFDNAGREDWNQTAGLELHWKLCPNSTVFTHVFFSNNDSNSAFGQNDFQAWTTGLGLGLNYSF